LFKSITIRLWEAGIFFRILIAMGYPVFMTMNEHNIYNEVPDKIEAGLCKMCTYRYSPGQYSPKICRPSCLMKLNVKHAETNFSFSLVV
jgi:hypothetical protein